MSGKLVRAAGWLLVAGTVPWVIASCSSSGGDDESETPPSAGSGGAGGSSQTPAGGSNAAGHGTSGSAGHAAGAAGSTAGTGGHAGSKGGAAGAGGGAAGNGGSKGGASGSTGGKGGSGTSGQGGGVAGSGMGLGGSPAGQGGDAAGGSPQGAGGAAAGQGGVDAAGGNGAGPGGASSGSGGQDAQGGAGGSGAGATGGSGDGFDVTHAPSTLGNFTTQGSTGCAMAGAKTGFQSVTLSVGGASRTGSIFVPDDYDAEKAHPVVFVFHGDGGTGAGIRSSLDLEPDAAGKAIFAYPDGANQTWDSTVIGDNADMGFVLALRDSLRSEYCVDTQRTFATGMSRGGFFVNQLSCRYGVAEFAAVAPHSSTIDPQDDNAYVYGPPNANGGPYMEGGNYDFACPSDGTPYPAHPIAPSPAFVIHGECDQEGGVEYPEGRRVAEHWGYAASCSTTPAVAVTTSPNPSCASGQLTSSPTLTVDPCYVAPGCASGHDITFCAIPSMDHRVWAEAHSRIWAFFAAH